MHNLQTRETLIQRIRNQEDEHSWKEFSIIYRRYILAVICKSGVSAADAEDVFQNTCISLWKSLPEFSYSPDDCKFRTWMSRVIRNQVYNYFRKKTREEKKLPEKKTLKTDPDVYGIAEKEWKIYIAEKAWENIKGTLGENSIQAFTMMSNKIPVEEICRKLSLKINSVYVSAKRVERKMKEEIRRLNEDLG